MTNNLTQYLEECIEGLDIIKLALIADWVGGLIVDCAKRNIAPTEVKAWIELKLSQIESKYHD